MALGEHVESTKSKVTLESADARVAGGPSEELVGARESSYERSGAAGSAAIGCAQHAPGSRSLEAPHRLGFGIEHDASATRPPAHGLAKIILTPFLVPFPRPVVLAADAYPRAPAQIHVQLGEIGVD